MAPEVGLEPTTNRLTADRSTTELLRNLAGMASKSQPQAGINPFANIKRSGPKRRTPRCGRWRRGLTWAVSKRLFLGLELPLPTREMLARLDPRIRGVRWVPAEQMHLTMSFLSQTNPNAEERLRAILPGVRVGSFFLPLEGVGVFGGERPTVVWAGIGNGHPHLFALHKRIQDAVLGAGLEPDLRRFHPHVTLGRAKNVTRQDLKAFLLKFAHAEFDFVRITGFTLFSSMLSREGATHTVEMRVEF
jgi:RNA 2',3'-cyclic 3'-phosphodiesterase